MAWTRLPYCSPYRLVWAVLREPHTPAQKVHQAYAWYVWRSNGWSQYFIIAMLCLAWPAVFLAQACLYTLRIGPKVARATGKSVLRQLCEQLWIAVRHSIAPDSYYVFELFRPERLRNAPDYILRCELKGGVNNLAHHHWVRVAGNDSTWTMKNKEDFFRACSRGGVASPAIFAAVEPDGSFRMTESRKFWLPRTGAVGPRKFWLPQMEIFIKPALGKGWRDCERWRFADGAYCGPGGRRRDAPGLLEHVRAMARRRGRVLVGDVNSLAHPHWFRVAGHDSSGTLKKRRDFFHACSREGVASPGLFAAVEPDGSFRMVGPRKIWLPRTDIFIKPAMGKGGRSCERWQFADGVYRGPGGVRRDAPGLVEHVRRMARRRGRILIQECLRNHPQLMDLGGSLMSLRITTCRNESGAAEVTNAVLKISLVPGSSVDNFHQGGAGCRVDIATGKVGPAFDSWVNNPCVRHETHPATGARIAGRILPWWPETVALVARCANLFPDRTMIGFDVAITDRGPVIIEANVQQSAENVQRTHDLPVGQQRLGELLAWNAAQALATRPPAVLKWFGPFKLWNGRRFGLQANADILADQRGATTVLMLVGLTITLWIALID